MTATADAWTTYRERLCVCDAIDLTLDSAKMTSSPAAVAEKLGVQVNKALDDMAALEGGSVANPDEDRMVGHYWLRAAQLAPGVELTQDIEETLERIRTFTKDVHSGKIAPPEGGKFTQVLSIGIGGSALGPQFVADALGDDQRDAMNIHFIDNTDPQGIARTLAALDGLLGETLCIVISKSGGTPETRNGMLAAAEAYEKAGLEFARHAVAITGDSSKLDMQAQKEDWLIRFPMWDWVGGRTSQTGPVGLVVAALQGLDIDGLLEGAAACDRVTRTRELAQNPALQMALMWYHGSEGKGAKDLVVLPYKDRLLLLSRYLQQLVMESLGKRLDLNGQRVDQGLAVYGNKGSTDQHAYVQQLRDGTNNFFATFIRVLEAGGKDVEVEQGITANDYLHGFLLGTREALAGNDRQSMTITVQRVDAKTVGVLIALFERAVGFYASLIGINAYHQPGVEAGKKAAASVLELQLKVAEALSRDHKDAPAIAEAAGATEQTEAVFLLLEHLAANGRAVRRGSGADATFALAR